MIFRILFRAMVLAIVCSAFISTQPANAGAVPGSVFAPSACDNLSNYSYGLSTGTIYCVKQTICNAAVGTNCDGTQGASSSGQGFIQAIISNLQTFIFACLVLAMALFGVKVLTLSTDSILQDGITLLFKIGIVFYLISNAGPLFLALINAIGELIGFVSVGFTTATSQLSAAGLCNATTTFTVPPTSSGATNEYQVWQAFDCILSSLFGIGLNATAVKSGILMILLPAFFTNTLGVICFMLGVTAFLTVVVMLFRALYLVLLAYIAIAFLIIIMPLIIPFFLFDGKYFVELFKKWVGLIISTLFQPMFVIAFLSMVVLVIDTFVDDPANLLSSCQVYVPSGATSDVTTNNLPNTAQGLCPLIKLFGIKSTDDPDTRAAKIQPYIELNISLLNWLLSGDPQANSGTSSLVNQAINIAKTMMIGAANQLLKFATGIQVNGPSRLNMAMTPLVEMFQTLIALFLVTLLMKELMEKIPQMAERITISVGLSLASTKFPLENAIFGARDGMNAAMMKAASGTSLFKDPSSVLTVARAGITGGFDGFLRNLGGGTPAPQTVADNTNYNQDNTPNNNPDTQDSDD